MFFTISDTFADFCSTNHYGFRIPWSSFTFVKFLRHTACAVVEIPQPTKKTIKLCKAKSIVCNALHEYVRLIYHKLHIYCLYIYLTRILQNIPPNSTGNEQLKQDHAHVALLYKGLVDTSSPYATNWSTLRVLCERYVFDRCKRLNALVGCGGSLN